jgi:hypothetical protein
MAGDLTRSEGSARARGVADGKDPDVIEAERRPLVTYSKGIDKAWAAKVEGDWWPAPPRRSRLPMIAAATAASLFIAAFFAGRVAAVAALPDLWGLYAALGLPVNLDGLAIEEVAADWVPNGEGARLSVRGVVRNVSGREQPAPALTASVYDSGMKLTGWRDFDPPAHAMAIGEAAPFQLEIEGVPREARKVVLRFRRPAEPARAGEGGGRPR